MMFQYILIGLLSAMLVVLGGPFITKAMSNAIDMQLNMQAHQLEKLKHGNRIP